MVTGFIVNDAEVAGIGTSYALAKAILLHEDAAADPRSRALPQCCFVQHLELVVDVTAGSLTTLNAYITWDSTGDDIMAGPASLTSAEVVAGLTDTSLVLCTVPLGEYRIAPTGQTTAGKCYLFVKSDATTITVKKARLVWRDER